MTLYVPPSGDRVQVAVAEFARRKERERARRAILAARRTRGLEARQAAKLARVQSGGHR